MPPYVSHHALTINFAEFIFAFHRVFPSFYFIASFVIKYDDKLNKESSS